MNFKDDQSSRQHVCLGHRDTAAALPHAFQGRLMQRSSHAALYAPRRRSRTDQFRSIRTIGDYRGTRFQSSGALVLVTEAAICIIIWFSQGRSSRAAICARSTIRIQSSMVVSIAETQQPCSDMFFQHVFDPDQHHGVGRRTIAAMQRYVCVACAQF